MAPGRRAGRIMAAACRGAYERPGQWRGLPMAAVMKGMSSSLSALGLALRTVTGADVSSARNHQAGRARREKAEGWPRREKRK